MFYQSDVPDTLEQGDVLKRTDDLLAVIGKYHPYYAANDKNKFFIVLTQSCDLVRRDGPCSARYLSLAPTRLLELIVSHEFEDRLENVEVGSQPFGTHKAKASIEQFLARLFNNNEPPFFFFPAQHEIGIYGDMCGILALPISLKPEHYETLLAAKITGITDVFQAKLGWLIGQMYSRVGTKDLPAEVLSRKVSDHTEGAAVWVEDADAKQLAQLVTTYRAVPGNGVVGAKELSAMLLSLPKKKKQVIDAVLAVVTAQGLVENPSPQRFGLRKALESDPAFSKLF